MAGEVRVMSNLVVSTDNLEIKDNEIVINFGESGSGVTSGFAGIRIDRGTANDFLIQFNETSGKLQVGTEGSQLQTVVSTDEVNIIDGGTW